MKNIHTLIQFIQVGIWQVSRKSSQKWNLMSILKIVVLSVKLCFKQRLNVQASALTYYSFFATIPTLAFIIAICRGFGYDETVFNYLKSSLSPTTDIQTIESVFKMVESYLSHAKGGMFIGIGIIFLLWSIYNVFSQTEKSINEIWGVTKLRPLVRRFTDYFSLTLLIPFLIIISSGFTIYFRMHITQITASWVVDVIMATKPWIISWSICTLVYMVIPNTRVQFFSALLAGVLAGTSVIIFKGLFFFFMKWATSYNAVYGSMAIIPIVLLFIRITWLILLCGAEISYARQKYEMYEFENEINQISPRYQLCIELYLLKIFAEKIEKGKVCMTFREISMEFFFPPKLLGIVLMHLCSCDLLRELEDKEKTVYVLNADVSKLTVGTVLAKLRSHGRENFLDNEVPELGSIWKLVEDIDKRLISDNQQVLIKNL
ncbi:MAG: YihY/virulence factor BrkB family protein [Paludibacteraceae bacterium]|nr:YihY/virulence factor BrkB family protein [Paludibacteraceae bacterium]